MCRDYGPPGWPIGVWISCSFFILTFSVFIKQARERTRPQIVEEPDPDTAEDALPQSYVTG